MKGGGGFSYAFRLFDGMERDLESAVKGAATCFDEVVGRQQIEADALIRRMIPMRKLRMRIASLLKIISISA